jgi:hypothetical protein
MVAYAELFAPADLAGFFTQSIEVIVKAREVAL